MIVWDEESKGESCEIYAQRDRAMLDFNYNASWRSDGSHVPPFFDAMFLFFLIFFIFNQDSGHTMSLFAATSCVAFQIGNAIGPS